MAKLYFKVASDWEEVVKLKNEIVKLKQELKGVNAAQSPAAFNALNTQLSASTQQFNGLVMKAAQAGATIEGDFKKKIFDASQSVNAFTEKIIAQKEVVKRVEADVKRLGEAYSTALKNKPFYASSKLSDYTSAKRTLDEEKAALFGLTQEQANVRLSVKKLRDEYALYKDESKGVVSVNDNMGLSLGKALGVIGGVAALKKLGSEIVRVRGEFQSMQTAIETLVGKDMAGNLIPQIKELAKVSPLTLSDMVAAEKMMLGFNVKAEDTIRYLQALSDISMGNSQKFNSLTLAFSQMSASGKLMGQDLNQMINAGFNPLQQISEKTGKSIAQLKDEMSKGAVSADMVQQAFIDATSAGGKFYQMSENASKTINGQISMMQDALDNAFNEMGQASEGFIMSSIQATTSLIQNYETVGKVLLALIEAYGVYRSALIFNAVLEQGANNAIWTKIKATKVATAAQAVYNKVMMMNPYVAIGAAVISLGLAMWTLADHTSAAEKAQKRYNDGKEEAKRLEDEHKQKIENLISVIENELSASLDRAGALDELKKAYPGIIEKYFDEEGCLKNILGLKKEIAELDSQKKVEQDKENYSEIRKSLSEAYKELEKFEKTPSAKSTLGSVTRNRLKENIRQLEREVDLAMDDVKKNDLAKFNTQPREIKILSLENNVKSLQAEIQEMEKIVQDEKQKNIGVSLTEFLLRGKKNELKNKKEQLNGLKETGETTTYQQDLVDAKKAWNEAKKEYEVLLKDQKATSAQVKKAKDDLATKEKSYKDLGGVTDVSSKQKSDKNRQKVETAERQRQIAENGRKMAAQNAQEELELRQVKIDLLKEGNAKELAQINLNYDKLIAANRQRETEMVKELQESERLDWENKNPKFKDKGLVFTPQKTAADLTAAQQNTLKEYTQIANTYKENAEADLLKKLLDKYRSFEQQRTDINKQFEAERKVIENSGKLQSDKDSAISVLEKKRREEIKAVNDEEVESMQKSSDLLVKLFADASQKSVKELRSIINTTEELLTYLEQTNSADITPKFGFTVEQLKSLKESPEKLKAIQDAAKNLKGEVGDRSPFENFKQDILEGVKQIKAGFKDIEGEEDKEGKIKIGEGIAGIGSSIKAVMPAVKQFGDDLGTIFGDSQIGEDIGILTELIGGVGQGLQGIGQIASGDILGGITNITSGIASIFSMSNAAAQRHRQALEAVMDSIIAQQREYNLLLLKQNLLYEQGTTVFGSDDYGKAANAIKVYKKALDDLQVALVGGKRTSGERLTDMLGLKETQSGLKQIYAGLADIEIVTGHKKTGLFGWGKGKDTFSSVLDVYPELIKANGEFNKELAQTIISTRKMSDEDKNAMQNMVNLYEQYEEAMQSVRDYLTDIFGELGNTMSDALVDAFKNGTDAGEAFYKSVSEMLENLAQQMIYSVTLAPIMEKAQEQMLEIMKNGNLTDAEKFAQYADVLSNLTDEAITQQNNANDLLKLYQDMAAGKGFDIFKPDETTREASSKGIATASQDSVDENNGRLTAIQGFAYSTNESVKIINSDHGKCLVVIQEQVTHIGENVKKIIDNSAAILTRLANIDSNTARLEKIENDIGAVKNGIDTINMKGIILRR